MSEEMLLEIDTDAELKKIMQRLEKLKDQMGAPNILKNALNSTARKVRQQLIKDAKTRYALQDKKPLKSESSVSTASAMSLEATVRAKGAMQDIMAFMTRPNTKTGAAAAQVLNSGSMKALEMGRLKAFVTTFESGHTAIVQRKGADRLPVKKLLSPAVPMLLGNEEIRAKAETMAYDLLQSEISKRIEKVLGT